MTVSIVKDDVLPGNELIALANQNSHVEFEPMSMKMKTGNQRRKIPSTFLKSNDVPMYSTELDEITLGNKKFIRAHLDYMNGIVPVRKEVPSKIESKNVFETLYEKIHNLVLMILNMIKKIDFSNIPKVN